MMSSTRQISLVLSSLFVLGTGQAAESTAALLPAEAPVSSALSLAALPGAAAAEQPKQCVPSAPLTAEERKAEMRKNPRAFNNVRALVGVDVLGRALVALDSNYDGLVDFSFMFTDTMRIEGPWSVLLEHATVFLNNGSAKVESHDRSLGMAFSLEGANLPKLTPRKYERVLIREAGWGFTRSTPGPQEIVELRSLDVNSIYTWPVTFQNDLLAPPGTFPPNCNCMQMNCQTGGCNSIACSLTEHDGSSCQVTCNPAAFACCKLTILGPPSCGCYAYSQACLQ